MTYRQSVANQRTFALGAESLLKAWMIVAFGLAVLLLPMYVSLASGLWQEDSQIHAPIIAIVTLYLFWLKREAINRIAANPRPVVGGLFLLFGLALYIVGRSQNIPLFDVSAQIPVLIGITLCMHGAELLKVFWFPLFFLFFMIPLPGFILDVITQPLKHYVSVWGETLLYYSGYPIARDGVVLSIGPYQLLVADACSGLNAMFSLSSMGLLYLYLMQHQSFWRNTLLIVSILPMAFLANLIRVIVLVLITYYIGDEAAQGFLHGSAGMVLFIAGLLILIVLDFMLGRIWPDRLTAPRPEQS